jgi:endonuclease-3
LDVLIETILSQNTSDANSLRAYASLRRAFPSWASLADSKIHKVAEAIMQGGLANIKSKRILGVVRDLRRVRGRPTLEHLRHMEPEAAYRELKEIDGVGPKTAACTLLFGAGLPIFPVDTHIYRVCGRLGWVRPREGREGFQERFRRQVPDDLVYPLHLNLIEHGRRACHARKPGCPTCCIKKICPFGKGKK